jgi:hypothetical protein
VDSSHLRLAVEEDTLGGSDLTIRLDAGDAESFPCPSPSFHTRTATGSAESSSANEDFSYGRVD